MKCTTCLATAAFSLLFADLAAAQLTPPAPVYGKEYSNDRDEDMFGAFDPLNNLHWDNPMMPVDTFDYSGSGPPPLDPDQVDALANHQDRFFFSVMGGATPFICSFQTVIPFVGDDLYYHDVTGATGLWADGPTDINQFAPPDDVDAVELWGSPPGGFQHDPWFGQPPANAIDDANNYSILGDCIVPAPPLPPVAISVYYYDPILHRSTTYITHQQLQLAIFLQHLEDPDLQPIEDERPVDIDALMVFDQAGNGIWEQGDIIIFSLWDTASTLQLCGGGPLPPNPFDGGEIWVWQNGMNPQFLLHGGRVWDTPNPVASIFNVPVENINAFESVGCLNYASFCDGFDNALAACPCGNVGLPDRGCDIAQATGGVKLEVLAQQTAPLNRATVRGIGYPVTSTPGAVLFRNNGIDPLSPVVFGDGVRCVDASASPSTFVRLSGTLAVGGVSTHTFGHGAMVGSGQFYYQIWFRNQPAMYCTPAAFNLSQGRILCW